MKQLNSTFNTTDKQAIAQPVGVFKCDNAISLLDGLEKETSFIKKNFNGRTYWPEEFVRMIDALSARESIRDLTLASLIDTVDSDYQLSVWTVLKTYFEKNPNNRKFIMKFSDMYGINKDLKTIIPQFFEEDLDKFEESLRSSVYDKIKKQYSVSGPVDVMYCFSDFLENSYQTFKIENGKKYHRDGEGTKWIHSEKGVNYEKKKNYFESLEKLLKSDGKSYEGLSLLNAKRTMFDLVIRSRTRFETGIDNLLNLDKENPNMKLFSEEIGFKQWLEEKKSILETLPEGSLPFSDYQIKSFAVGRGNRGSAKTDWQTSIGYLKFDNLIFSDVFSTPVNNSSTSIKSKYKAMGEELKEVKFNENNRFENPAINPFKLTDHDKTYEVLKKAYYEEDSNGLSTSG